MVGTFFFLNQKSKCGPTVFCKILYDLWNVPQILLVNTWALSQMPDYKFYLNLHQEEKQKSLSRHSSYSWVLS